MDRALPVGAVGRKALVEWELLEPLPDRPIHSFWAPPAETRKRNVSMMLKERLRGERRSPRCWLSGIRGVILLGHTLTRPWFSGFSNILCNSGFVLGASARCPPPPDQVPLKNNRSSEVQPEVVDAWLAAERIARRIIGPFTECPWADDLFRYCCNDP